MGLSYLVLIEQKPKPLGLFPCTSKLNIIYNVYQVHLKEDFFQKGVY